MKEKKRRPFYFTLSSIAVLAILAGIVFSRFSQPASTTHADSIDTQIQHGLQAASITPLRPMYNLAVKLSIHANTVSGINPSYGINHSPIVSPSPIVNSSPGVSPSSGVNIANVLPCLSSTTLPVCYSPQQIYGAYDVQPLLNNGITGQGETITIIDPFQDPTVRSDLQFFDQLFGLNDPQLNIIAPNGLTPFNANDSLQTSAAGEIALDVEWAHAMAPAATIDLVLANVQSETLQGGLAAALQATSYAVSQNLGSVISQSFGAGETCLPAAVAPVLHRIYQQARAQQQTVIASAGDDGAAVKQCTASPTPTLAKGVEYPASDPLVTGVGGTTLLASRTGAYTGESVWNESAVGHGATGGGDSTLFAQPTYQQNITGSQARAVDDISFDADPLTGVPVVTSSLVPGATVIAPFGGTSLGAPLAAGMTALLDQSAGKRLGFLNSAFYRISQNATAYAQTFHDVTTGNNTFVFQDPNTNNTVTVPGFTAQAGWDRPTGVGTPQVAELATLLPQFIQANDGAGL